MHYRAITILLFTSLATGCGTPTAKQSTYPNRRIKVIVPFSPGGETNTFARIIKKGIEVNNLLPVPLVIFNRDGAGATVGSRSVKNARPDGYTILLLHNALFTAKYAGTVNYGPEAFEAVAGTGQFGMVVAVSDSSKYRTLKELLQAAKAHPKSINFGINRGTPSHFAALMLENSFPGAQFNFPQSGSGVHRYSDVRGGHVEVSAFSIGEYVRFEKIRALAYFDKERHPGAPDVPTAIEQGFDLTTSNVQFWWFPKGTSRKKVDYFAGVLKKAMKTKYVREKLAEIHCDPVFLQGDALQQQIDEYTKRLEKISLRPTVPLPDVPVLVLCIIAGLLGWKLFFRVQSKSNSQEVRETASPPIPMRQLSFAIGLVILYVLLLSLELVHFIWVTMGFVIALGLTLTQHRWRALPYLVALAIVLALGLYYLFTQVFVIDLP